MTFPFTITLVPTKPDIGEVPSQTWYLDHEGEWALAGGNRESRVLPVDHPSAAELLMGYQHARLPSHAHAVLA